MSICYIDIIDRCNLACPTCARGRQLIKNTTNLMSIETFERIVTKVKNEGYIFIGIYNWMEPFLCNNFYDYVSVVKSNGLKCQSSSNLSLDPNNFERIEKTLIAGIDHLIVSVSGYSQDIHEINHKNSNISWVKQNLEKISELINRANIKTNITLRFIKFDYNLDQECLLEEYAKSLKINFEAIIGVGHPNSPEDDNIEQIFINKICNSNANRLNELKGKICPLIENQIAIDSRGDVYLCCAFPYFSCLRIGNYLDMTKDDILLQRYYHTYCLSCHWPRIELTKEKRSQLVNATKHRTLSKRKNLS